MVVSPETIETDVFTTLRTLIIANKPTYTRTIGETETEFEYDLVSEYPTDNPSFPLIALNSAKVSLVLLDLDGSGEDYGIEVQLDFYVKELHGTKAIEEGRQAMRQTFIGNISEFRDTDEIVPAEDFWDDSNISQFQDRNQIVHTGSAIIKFKLK